MNRLIRRYICKGRRKGQGTWGEKSQNLKGAGEEALKFVDDKDACLVDLDLYMCTKDAKASLERKP